MSRVNVKKEIYNWAIDRAGYTTMDLKKNFPKIEEWIKGEIHPTYRQLNELAKKTKTPFGFFFLDKPPKEELAVPFFRTFEEAEKKPSLNLFESIQIIRRRQDWIREYLIDLGRDPLTFVNSVSIDEEVKLIATKTRELLRLNEDWASAFNTWEEALTCLKKAMEEIGVFVVFNGIVGNNTHRKLDPEEFRGFVLVDDYAPFVFVNNRDFKVANMFTLAHELAHILLGKSAIFDLRQMLPADNHIEKLCDKVAAEFLVPEKAIRKIWNTVKHDTEPFDKLARYFKVSALVTARRTLDLGYITKEDFFEFYNKLINDERRKSVRTSSGGDFYSNQNYRIGKRFATAVITALKDNKLSYQDAYRLTGLYGKTLNKYADLLELRGL